MPKSYREWRVRANAHLARLANVDAWADAHILTALRQSPSGMKLWSEARDHDFWMVAHAREQEQ